VKFVIDRREIWFSAVRSGGPGGQNVNKVSSAAILRWPYLESQILSDEQKLEIGQKLKNWINKNNEIYVRSEETRDLERNRQHCISKLEALVTKALHKPKKRYKTKPTRASQKKRVESKQKRGEIKKARSKVRL
jgi:ribosome-associated protein